MNKFHLRKGAVEAIQFFESSISEVNYFFEKVGDGKKLVHMEGFGDYRVSTPTGQRIVEDGHWILRELDGSYSVYDAEAFDQLYEKGGG